MNRIWLNRRFPLRPGRLVIGLLALISLAIVLWGVALELNSSTGRAREQSTLNTRCRSQANQVDRWKAEARTWMAALEYLTWPECHLATDSGGCFSNLPVPSLATPTNSAAPIPTA